MLKFAANLSTMFSEPDELDRVTHAARLGFRWVEWLFPYERDVARIKAALEEHELELILINAAAGDRTQGEVGIGALPHRVDAFREAMSRAFEYTTQLNVPMIHVMAGKVPADEDRQKYVSTFVDNLKWASEQIGNGSPRLLVEPLNRIDTPSYLIGTTAEAMEVIGSVDREIGLQYDFYHLQIMQGNLGRNLEDLFEQIAHIQFSSVPGRHEPQYGEINHTHLFDKLEELDYEGFIGCEYRPKDDVDAGLTWARPYGIGDR